MYKYMISQFSRPHSLARKLPMRFQRGRSGPGDRRRAERKRRDDGPGGPVGWAMNPGWRIHMAYP